jgi:hypothetical protein
MKRDLDQIDDLLAAPEATPEPEPPQAVQLDLLSSTGEGLAVGR